MYDAVVCTRRYHALPLPRAAVCCTQRSSMSSPVVGSDFNEMQILHARLESETRQRDAHEARLEEIEREIAVLNATLAQQRRKFAKEMDPLRADMNKWQGEIAAAKKEHQRISASVSCEEERARAWGKCTAEQDAAIVTQFVQRNARKDFADIIPEVSARIGELQRQRTEQAAPQLASVASSALLTAPPPEAPRVSVRGSRHQLKQPKERASRPREATTVSPLNAPINPPSMTQSTADVSMDDKTFWATAGDSDTAVDADPVINLLPPNWLETVRNAEMGRSTIPTTHGLWSVPTESKPSAPWLSDPVYHEMVVRPFERTKVAVSPPEFEQQRAMRCQTEDAAEKERRDVITAEHATALRVEIDRTVGRLAQTTATALSARANPPGSSQPAARCSKVPAKPTILENPRFRRAAERALM